MLKDEVDQFDWLWFQVLYLSPPSYYSAIMLGSGQPVAWLGAGLLAAIRTKALHFSNPARRTLRRMCCCAQVQFSSFGNPLCMVRREINLNLDRVLQTQIT